MRYSLCAAILLTVTATVFLPSIHAGMIYEDRRDAALSLDVTKTGLQLQAQPLRSVTTLSRWADLTVCGVSAYCLHGNSVLWHLLNTGLLLAVAWLFLPPWGALAAAVVFALHPLQVEAVAYVSARSDLLSACGLLLALLSTSRGSVAGALLGVLFASLAKETALVAWGLVFLWAAWTRQTAFARWWALIATAGATTGALLIWPRIGNLQWAFSEELAGQQLAAIWRLLFLLPVPYGFTIDHDWTSLAWLAPIALILSLALTAWSLTEGWWGRHWLAFGWLWTLVAVSPRLVVPLYEGLHERHFYVVAIGWALCAGAWLSKTSAPETVAYGQ